MPNSHILRDFDLDLAALRSEVLSMAASARLNLDRAVQALLTRNVELANAVIADDDEVDDSERKIDQMGMDIMVRYHPVATDLRLVVSSMRISMNLERIADHAVNIAKRARKMSANQDLPDVRIIEPLHTLADHLLRDAISAYSGRDAELGAGLHGRDKELDAMHKAANATFGSRIEQGTDRSQDYLHLILVTRSLERVGDLAVNIGEDAVFLDHARDLRHEADRRLDSNR